MLSYAQLRMFLSLSRSLTSSSLKGSLLFIYLFVYCFIWLFSFPLFPGSIAAAQPNRNTESAINEDKLPACQPIYGGGENCIQTENIAIDKKVQNPQTLKYVDNLYANDPGYNPGQIVQFQISVKNSSNKPASNIIIKDRLPQYMDCSSEEADKCNNAAKIITLTIDNLKSNETKAFILKGKTASAPKLPAGKQTICVVNQGVATRAQQTSQDNAQFCIQKNGVSSTTTPSVNQTGTKGGLSVYSPSKTKTTPPTGPETLSLLGLIAAGVLGSILRKNRIKRSK